MKNPQYHRDTCYFCGDDSEEVLEEHHIVPRRHGGSDLDENLVRVCPTCHSKLERLYGPRFYRAVGPDVGGLAGARLVKDLSEIEFTHDIEHDAIDARLAFKQDLLKHYGIDIDRHICKSCHRITFFIEREDGPRCGRCNTVGEDVGEGYSEEFIREVYSR